MVEQTGLLEYLENCLEASQRKVLSHFQSKQVNDFLQEKNSSIALDFDSEEFKTDWQVEIDLLFKYWLEEFIFRLTMHISSNTEAEEIQHDAYVDFTTSESFASKMGTLSGDKYQRQIFSLQQKLYLQEKEMEKLKGELTKKDILLENRQNKMETARREHLLVIHGLSRDLDSIIHSNEQYVQYFDVVVREIENSHHAANQQFIETDDFLERIDYGNVNTETVKKYYRDQKKVFRKIFRKENTIISLLKDKTQYLFSEARKRKRRQDESEANNIVAKRRVFSKSGEQSEEDVVRMVSFAEAKNADTQTNPVIVWEKEESSTNNQISNGSNSSKKTVLNSLMEQGDVFVDKILALEEKISLLQRINNGQRMELEDCYSRLLFAPKRLSWQKPQQMRESAECVTLPFPRKNIENTGIQTDDIIDVDSTTFDGVSVASENYTKHIKMQPVIGSPSPIHVKISDLSNSSPQRSLTSKQHVQTRTRSNSNSLHIPAQFATKATASQGSSAENLLQQLFSLSNEIDNFNSLHADDIVPFHSPGRIEHEDHLGASRKNRKMPNSYARRTSTENKADLIEMSEIANHSLSRDSLSNSIQPFEFVTPTRESDLNKHQRVVLSVSKKPVTRKKPSTAGASTKSRSFKETSRGSSLQHVRLPSMKSHSIPRLNPSSIEKKRPTLEIDIVRAFHRNESQPSIPLLNSTSED